MFDRKIIVNLLGNSGGTTFRSRKALKQTCKLPRAFKYAVYITLDQDLLVTKVE